MDKRHTPVVEERNRFANDLKGVQAKLATLETTHAKCASDLSATSKDRDEWKGKYVDLDKRHTPVVEERNRFANDLKGLQRDFNGLEKTHSRCAADLKSTANDRDRWKSRHDKVENEHRSCATKLDSVKKEHAAMKMELDSHRKDAAKAKAEAEAARKRALANLKPDDLKKVEGIGPKIEGILNSRGIKTWKQLSETSPKRIKEYLDEAGPRYRMHDPGSWPKQAGMAARGEWKRLEKWQDEHSHGRE